MEKDLVKRYIERINPWWEEELEIDWFKERDIYGQIKKFIDTKQILALTGLRRTGKTSIIKKIINDYLDDGVPSQNILYFSFDDFSDLKIIEVLEAYEEIIDKKIRDEEFVIAFDEIQKLENWSGQLKAIYDTYPNVKFIISGSESLFIRKKSRESLAGRIFVFELEPLNFKEFLDFKGIKINSVWMKRDLLKKEFTEYLECNGFPEIVNAKSEVIEKYIREGVIDRVIYKDMPDVFDLRDPELMKSLFNIIYNDPGQIIDIQTLADELGVSRQVVSSYLKYLEDSYLIRRLYNFSKNERKVQRKLKKYYSTIINPLLIENNFPKIFEQAIVNELKGEFFWRDPYKNEVDLILTKPEVKAIEIKSGQVRKNDLEPLGKFIEKFRPKKAFVISRDVEKKENDIEVIPFYKHFLKDNRNI